MITFTQGNLLEARAEALVNTVNTVGVMGKGIALMFKERFAENFHRYATACKTREVRTGKMFITEVHELDGPRWIVNFPTKQHWRDDSRIEWIIEGLQDLRRFLIENKVKSIAIPPLGAGLRHWRGSPDAAVRKDRLFDDRALGIALERLTANSPVPA
jgi:O-acetyl-ADP-ribose deacetylase (regulator of RNase III)